MKYIDLFAGVGGFRYGIDRVAEALRAKTEGNADNQELSSDHSSDSVQVGRQPDFTCVYSNEWDKYANSVYRRHYGECDNRDIRTVPTSDIPDHDLLVGGFPCQSFSVAGKRGGFNDTRGTLFFEIARLAAEKQPRLLLLENVKGLLNHDQGRTFRTILASLDELGYDAQWQVLNSKDFGVPQNRERVFIIGHLRGTPRPKVFPLTTTNSKTLKELTTQKSQGYRVYDVNEISTTITSQAGEVGGKTGLYAIPVLTPNRLKKRQNGRWFKTNGEPSFTLTGQDVHGVMIAKYDIDNALIRRLTPKECERLQGFPDNWTQYDADGKLVSDTQRYKMMGNAVTTNVITAIAEKLL